ncbi:MAG TPA: hypothetical protein ENN66_08820 [Proteobacteria bacterium]|nr:hypothetical protein [Pseudomonadota bacterium]
MKKKSPSNSAPSGPPLWLINLALFGILILVVLLYFFRQAENERRSFNRHSQEHAQLLARVIQLNADNAVAAAAAIREAAHTFLFNSARFVDYLAAIEPFNEEELTALALESGLNGITLRNQLDRSSGPPGWESEQALALLSQSRPEEKLFIHDAAGRMFLFFYPRRESEGGILLGFNARGLEELQDRVGLPRLLQTLSGLPGINQVGIVAEKPADLPGALPESRRLPANMMVEVRLPSGHTLVAGFDAEFLFARQKSLWRDFLLFALILSALGIFFSWLLYRYQLTSVHRARDFERRLAREHEDAALGRAAAALAHEIKNPLNAIAIGLQRLELEDSGLTPEYARLVEALRQAVGRADHIVGDLRRFAHPLHIRKQALDLVALLDNLITLYREYGNAAGIEISLQSAFQTTPITIMADADLLGQALENLFKNAAEAQPKGGWLKISLQNRNNFVEMLMENPGLRVPAPELERIVKPWFTTKARGSGLGLAIVERIISAHGGGFRVSSPAPGILRQHIRLPAPGAQNEKVKENIHAHSDH